MQHIYGVLESDGINGTIGIAVVVLNDLKYASAGEIPSGVLLQDAFPRLGQGRVQTD